MVSVREINQTLSGVRPGRASERSTEKKKRKYPMYLEIPEGEPFNLRQLVTDLRTLRHDTSRNESSTSRSST
jgi:hypothetical protein